MEKFDEYIKKENFNLDQIKKSYFCGSYIMSELYSKCKEINQKDV
jgi:hypothetical protein